MHEQIALRLGLLVGVTKLEGDVLVDSSAEEEGALDAETFSDSENEGMLVSDGS